MVGYIFGFYFLFIITMTVAYKDLMPKWKEGLASILFITSLVNIKFIIRFLISSFQFIIQTVLGG